MSIVRMGQPSKLSFVPPIEGNEVVKGRWNPFEPVFQ